MVYTPLTIYRNEECRKLAERVERGAAYESLNVTVNIDTILPNRDATVLNEVVHAIAENTNFVLFQDNSHYIIIIPCKLAVACYVDGLQVTMEVMTDMQQFQNRIKIAVVVYDKFSRIGGSLESGRHGNDALPLHTAGEDLHDGEKGAGESQASIQDQVIRPVQGTAKK